MNTCREFSLCAGGGRSRVNFVSVFRWRPSCLASLTMWARVGPFCGSTRRQQKSERGRTTLTSMTEEFEGPEVIARRMRLVLPRTGATRSCGTGLF